MESWSSPAGTVRALLYTYQTFSEFVFFKDRQPFLPHQKRKRSLTLKKKRKKKKKGLHNGQYSVETKGGKGF